MCLFKWMFTVNKLFKDSADGFSSPPLTDKIAFQNGVAVYIIFNDCNLVGFDQQKWEQKKPQQMQRWQRCRRLSVTQSWRRKHQEYTENWWMRLRAAISAHQTRHGSAWIDFQSCGLSIYLGAATLFIKWMVPFTGFCHWRSLINIHRHHRFLGWFFTSFLFCSL